MIRFKMAAKEPIFISRHFDFGENLRNKTKQNKTTTKNKTKQNKKKTKQINKTKQNKTKQLSQRNISMKFGSN